MSPNNRLRGGLDLELGLLGKTDNRIGGTSSQRMYKGNAKKGNININVNNLALCSDDSLKNDGEDSDSVKLKSTSKFSPR